MIKGLLIVGMFLLSSAPGDTVALVATGDEAFFRIDYAAAVPLYESSLELSPSQPEILWRLARVYVCMGEVAEESEQEELFRNATMYSRRCISADSTRAEGHTWLAGALGYTALNEATKNQLDLMREMMSELDRAITLNPNDDIAYSIKGSMYRALGNVGWLQRQLAALLFGGIPPGGYEEAEVALKQAILLAPDVMRHHYELGVLYQDWNRTDEAKAVLRHAETLPVRVAIDRQRLETIKNLLAELDQE